MPAATVPSETRSTPTSVRTVNRQTRRRKSASSPSATRTRPKAPTTIATRTRGVYTLAAAHEDMRGALTADVLEAFVAERAPVHALEKRLALTQQDRPHGEMQLVDQPRLEILAHRRDAAADTNILAPGGRLCLLERRLDPLGDEVEHRAALHLERGPPVMCQYEHRRVIRRLFAPPAAPALVRPRPAHRP